MTRLASKKSTVAATTIPSPKDSNYLFSRAGLDGQRQQIAWWKDEVTKLKGLVQQSSSTDGDHYDLVNQLDRAQRELTRRESYMAGNPVAIEDTEEYRNLPDGVVGLGTIVTVDYDDGEVARYILLHEEERENLPKLPGYDGDAAEIARSRMIQKIMGERAGYRSDDFGGFAIRTVGKILEECPNR